MSIREHPMREYRSVTELKPIGFNAPSRTTNSAIRDLKESIKRQGILDALIINEDGIIIDGHRRFSCAKQLGLEQVPVEVVHGDPGILYAEINSTSRKMSNAEMLFAHVKGAVIPVKYMKRLEPLMKLVGPEWIEYLADNGRGASAIAHQLPTALKYLGKENPPYQSGNNKFAKKFAIWNIKYQQVMRIRTAMAEGISPEYIIQAVEQDVPLMRLR